MKLILTLITAFIITACADCSEPIEAINSPLVVPTTPEVNLTQPEPVITQPTVVVYCLQSVDCVKPLPYPLPRPRKPIEVFPNPVGACIRDSTPLVLIDEVLTDNCGNKYEGVK